jgi:hypothetical protein
MRNTFEQLPGNEPGIDAAAAFEVLQAGRRDWIETGRALRTIRDAKLYRAEFRRFDEFIAQCARLAHSSAYRFMDGSVVLDNLYQGTDLEHVPERHVRPLTKFAPELQRAAWQIACDAAPKDEAGTPKLTAGIVARAAAQVAAQAAPEQQHRDALAHALVPGVPA